MRPSTRIFHLRVIIGLVAACIVTACVKNDNKDGGRQSVASKTLQSLEISEAQLNESGTLKITENSEIPAAEIIQEFILSVSQIREFRAARGNMDSLNCANKKTVVPSISLIDSNGKEQILEARDSVILLPGRYTMKTVIQNQGLCKEINLSIQTKSEIREDLTLPQNQLVQFQCALLEDHDDIEWVEVGTSPLKVIAHKKTKRSGKSYYYSDINNLCLKELAENEVCFEQSNTAQKSDNPFVAQGKSCHFKNRENRKTTASLQMNIGSDRYHGNFQCRGHGHSADLKLSDCTMTYNFGRKLEIQPGSANFTVNRDRVILYDYEVVSGFINDESIPQSMYVQFYYRGNNGTLRKISRRRFIRSYEDFLDKGLSFHQDDMGQQIKNLGVGNVYIVFSELNDRTSGLFHIKLGDICSHSENQINGRFESTTESLCEEN